MPLDPAYDQQLAGYQSQLDNTLANLQYLTGRTRQDYGFDDPSNPFNKAAMFIRAFEQGQAGTLNSAGRQLYSGSTQSALDEGRFRFNRGYSDLRQEYADALQRLQQQGAEARTTFAQESAQAFADRLERALQNRPEDPGTPTSGPAAPAGPPRPNGPSPSRPGGQYAGSNNYAPYNQRGGQDRGYRRLDEIRAFLNAHPDLKKRDPKRWRRLQREAEQLKSWLPSRHGRR